MAGSTDVSDVRAAAIENDWESSGALTLNRLLHRLALAEPFRYRNPGSAP